MSAIRIVAIVREDEILKSEESRLIPHADRLAQVRTERGALLKELHDIMYRASDRMGSDDSRARFVIEIVKQADIIED